MSLFLRINRISIILSNAFIIILSIILGIILIPKSTFAATYNWNQSDWSGNTDTTNTPKHSTDQINWNKFYSKESTIKLDSGLITLQSTTQAVVHDSSQEFSLGTKTNTIVTASGQVQLSMSEGNVSLDGGGQHTCASTSNGSVYCWGQNSSGQLGIGSSTSSNLPIQVKDIGGSGTISNIKLISAGTSHTCGVKNDGSVWCWGLNTSGQLGNGNTTMQSFPVQVKGVGNTGVLTNIAKVAAGESHSCAIDNNGYVYCWGYGNFGALGNNSPFNSSYPVRVIDSSGTGFLSNIIDISTSDRYSCAVKNDGTGWCWGLGNWGQIGNGTQTESNLIPKPVSTVTNFKQINAGIHGHSCGVTTDKKIYCWGWGDYGSLGNGSNTAYQTTPVQVTGITDAQEVSAGYYHSCAVRSNGTIACWGGGDDGQLGNGTNTHTVNTFVLVSNISNGSKITNGANHSCALKSDGSVVCWGNGASGRLGNNGTTNSNVPTNTLNNTGDSQLFLSGYAPQGTFISSTINLESEAGFFNLKLNFDKPSNTTLKVEFKTADTETNLETAPWFGPSGEGSYFTNTSYDIFPSILFKNYVQYKVTLQTSNPLSTPSLSLIDFKYQSFSNSGFLISSPYDSETNETIISNISWIKSTPDNTSIKFQLRSAANISDITSKDWIGPDGTASTFFINNLGNNTPSILKDQSSDRWFQYKVFLETTSQAYAPTLYDVTTTYVINNPPEFDSTYQTNGFGITRDLSTPGIFNFLYKVRDTDTNQASTANQYKLWPSFQYSIDNGSTWNTIAPEQLTGNNTENPITLTDNSTYVEAATVWDARSVLPNTFTTMKVRVIVDDHEAANNTTAVTHDSFYFDTKKPVVGTVDGGGNGININHNQTTSLGTDKTNNSTVTLYFSAQDDSDLKIRYSTDSSFTQTEYQDYISSATFNLPQNDGNKTVYVQFKDIYGNETSVYSDNILLDTTPPTNPTNPFSLDISNANNNEYRVFVSWSKNNTTDFTSYKIYRLENQIFVPDQNINNIDTNYFVKSGLANLNEYTFKITSIDDLGNESIGTTITQATGSTPADTVSPEINNINQSDIDTNSATITWSTNETATSTILYSLTNNNFTKIQAVDGYSSSHSVSLFGLNSNTQYFYKIRSVDPSGNTTETNASSFTTLTIDTSGPDISNISSSNLTSTTAKISFTTNEPSTSFIEYSTQSGFSQGDIFGQSDLATSHNVTLGSLLPSTTYYYKVRSSDSLHNETVSPQNSFTTLQDPADHTNPVISNISVVNINHNSATVNFSTDETTLSFVQYGLDTNYNQTYGNNTDTTNHSINLPKALLPQSVYYYRIKSKDSSGNETISIGSSFATTADPADSTPPVISNVNINSPSQNSVTITWNTNELATSYVGFSTDTTYSSEQGKSALTNNHSITLIGLNPNTTYHTRIKSTDSVGNFSYDNNGGLGYTFTTQSGHEPPIISSISSNNIATSSATISWNTNTDSNSYVEYWLNENSVYWYGNNNLTQTHQITLPNLLSESTYSYRVRSKDSSNSEAVSTTYTFTTKTKNDSETPQPPGQITEDGILDKIKNGTVDFVKKVIDAVSQSTISEDELTNSLNNMTPKIISSPSISSDNIIVQPGIDKITVTWTTDKKSNSIVAYVPEEKYNLNNSDPYTTVIGNPNDNVTHHSVTIENLNPNTVYHYQVRSKSEYGNWTNSKDYTFTTLSINSKIKDFHFSDIGQNKVSASWATDFEARALIKIKDPLLNKSIISFEEKGFDRTHKFATDELQNSTNYQIEIINVAKDGTLSEPVVFPFSTAISPNPPEISNVRTSSALISGAVEQIQTIISWKTNKPSTSRIIYGEGTGDNLNQFTNLDKSLITDHIVVTTNLKPGKVYKFKVESVDASANTSTSQDYLIMTPKPQQSIIDLIIDNFTSSFSFISGRKK